VKYEIKSERRKNDNLFHISVYIAYLDEHQDAAETKQFINNLGRQSLPIPVDLRQEENCHSVVETTIKT
jgi:hypothetical protein